MRKITTLLFLIMWSIASGVEYEIDAKGQVVLAPGFTVEKGALFSVTQSDY